jgi:hypothetical protein
MGYLEGHALFLLTELKHRHVHRAAAVYAATGFVILHRAER